MTNQQNQKGGKMPQQEQQGSQHQHQKAGQQNQQQWDQQNQKGGKQPAPDTWKQPCRHWYALILAGGLLIAGGDSEVAAYAAKTGKVAWRVPVKGRAYGLAVANGRLLVSTDQGAIHCFAAAGG